MAARKKHDEAEAPKSKCELFSGEIKWSGTSFVGGLPIEGTVNIPSPHTKEGVFYAVRAANPSVSLEDFACEQVAKNG